MAGHESYPGTTRSELNQIVHAALPGEAANDVLKALRDAGLIKGSGGKIDFESVSSTDAPDTTVGEKAKLVLLGSGSHTAIASDHPVVVAATGGDNFLDATGSGNLALTLIAGSGNDTLVGNGGADLLQAGSGNDDVESGGGPDTIEGGSGTGKLLAGGQSVVDGGSGDYKIEAGRFKGSMDTVNAGTGHDTITLKFGDNTVHAPTGLGAATITAGAGHDTIFGGSDTQIHLGKGVTTFDSSTLTSKQSDTIYGGTSGTLDLTVKKSDVTITAVKGTNETTIAFHGGGTVTTVGTVNIVFSDSSKKTVS